MTSEKSRAAGEIHSGEDWRIRLIDGIYRVIAVIGLLPLSISLYLSLPLGEYFSVALFVSIYGVCVFFAVSRKVHYRIRAALLVIMVFCVGTMELYNGSMAADGSLYLFTCAIMVGILFGLRWGFAVVFLAILMFVVSAGHWLADPNNLPVDLNLMPTRPIVWFAAALNFVLLVAILMTAVDFVLRRLERSLAASRDLVDRLQEEIEERERGEEERRALEEQLRQTQRMEAVGQLAGGVAHDFNNLLQVILGYGEMAQGHLEADSPVRRDLGHMLEASERARALVRQLLAFSRRQVLEIEDLDLNRIVSDHMKMIKRVIGEHIAIDFTSGHDVEVVRADRGQIEQILMNVSVNARDAMGDGGTLTIETSHTELDEAFCETNGWATPGRYALLTISDTGCGMDEETKAQIFEPFFSTKEQGKGTGLGLSTVFGIVRQHGGMINVYSEAGVGTTFRIYLPTSQGQAPALEDACTPVPQGGTETILLADDDDLVRHVAQSMLTEAGYTVFVAEDGEEAIRIFDSHNDQTQLALLDVVMPKLGGKAVAEHMHATRPDLPVLFCSGYSRDAIHTNFVLDSGMHLIQKPYRRDELLSKIREMVETGGRAHSFKAKH